MAPTPGTLRVSRYFGSLGLILAVLYLLVLLPGNANTPKLGIDLVGGIRVIFTAVPPAGESVTSTSMEQARQIIEDRINGTGVTASTVQIQGDDQLVVQIPGGTDTDVQRLGRAAQLNFRPLIAPAQQVTCATPKAGASGSATPSGTATGSSAPASTAPSSTAPSAGAAANPSGSTSGSATGNTVNERKLAAAPTPTGTATRAAAATTPAPAATTPASTGAATTPAPSGAATTPAPSASPTGPPPACVADPIAVVQKADKTLATLPTTEAAYDKLTQTQKSELAAALANVDCTKTNLRNDDVKKPYVACQTEAGTSLAFLLGPVVVKGQQVDEATAVAPSTGQGGSQQWTVSLTLNDAGQTAWGKWTTEHNSSSQQGQGAQACGASTGVPCSDYVAFTLDGQVLSAPVTNEPIVGQATQISGNFEQKSANALADSLKFGALPLSFNLESNERVSASLGTSQLKAALLAGGIGLALVVLYSLLYYRGLGLVTIASLIVSGLLTYAMMVILGQQIGFTLDLSGIAGLIVALGITADSFVVFFERIKDEVHEGRSIRVAIPRAWIRARRTVLSADTVSFLAAAILYYFASADVKGFAFTLGLSTILDLVVVFLFTHPIVSLLARSKTFGSPRFTGLNSVRKGGITPDRDEPQVKRVATKRRAKAAGSTVVLDKETTVEDDVDVADDPVDTTSDVTTDATTDVTTDSDTVAEDKPRRRSAPAEGTAAERAAARRARQRQQRDEGND